MHPKIINIVTEDVCGLLKLDADRVFMLKVEYGECYLRDRYSHDREIYEALKCCPQFWKWWTSLWAERDRTLMKNIKRTLWGFAYTYACNHPKDERMFSVSVRAVMDNQTKEFYEDYHYWSRVK